MNSTNWTDFLGRPPLEGPLHEHGAANVGKTVLVTGAGGYLGSGLAEASKEIGVRLLILLECSEQSLESIERKLSVSASPVPHVSVLGDAGDHALLEEVLRSYRPEIIYHTAAFKYLPFVEFHPLAAVRNNAVVTYALAQAAARHGVERLILISTDKAVNPTSIMGASKRVAECVILALSSRQTLMTAVRLGNVLGSPGSVGPLFAAQIACGASVTVTNPAASRYFTTLEDSIKHILRAAAHNAGPRILIPNSGVPLKIQDLAAFLMRREGREVPMVFSRLRPGEKLSEQLYSDHESVYQCDDCGMMAARADDLPIVDVRSLLSKIEEIVRRRDAASLLREMLTMVPNYQPSAVMSGLAMQNSSQQPPNTAIGGRLNTGRQ